MGVRCIPSYLARLWVAEQTIGVDKRGVIVYVYAFNNNDAELKALEEGILGNYYN
jgi:hypothetical protein